MRRVAGLLMALVAALAMPAAAAVALPEVGMVDQPCPEIAPRPAELDARTLLELQPETPDPAQLSAPLSDRTREYFAALDAAAKGDWPNLCRFAADNVRLSKGPPVRAVFLGDSITENWLLADPALFTNGIVNRGISGQTSPQMLLRFPADVVALRPRVVHIMAGTNDLAGNTGPTSVQRYQQTISAMCDLARANGIRVVLASIPPAARFPWRPGVIPGPRILELNAWLRRYAAEHGFIYADYYAALADADGALRASLSHDGVHPHTAGYAVMRPLAERAIAAAAAGAARR